MDDGRFTYKELQARVNQLSHSLRDLGVAKGDRVAYLSANTSEMLEGFYGVLQLGAVFVPMNTRLEPEDYVYILNHSESTVLYMDESLDRKSTRLNSSHVAISYAVFCLKKKK